MVGTGITDAVPGAVWMSATRGISDRMDGCPVRTRAPRL
jgi:hypothetical protein